MQIGLYLKYPYLSDFNKSLTLSTDLEKYSNIKFNENRCSGSRILHAEVWGTDRQEEIHRS